MHGAVQDHVIKTKNLFPSFFTNKRVLEVGSLDINGSIRGAFYNCEYVGLDVGEGKGVDVVCPIHEYIHPEEFDVVISTEMLEHDRHWEASLKSMYDNLKEGGLLILTAAGPTRQEHGTSRTTPGDAPFTNDWYRNISVEDFSSILPKQLFKEYSLGYVRGDADIVFYGIKK